MKQIIVTVHGIHAKRLTGWQHKFWGYIKRKHPSTLVFAYRYGYLIAPLSWLMVVFNKYRIPTPIRKFYIHGFLKFLRKVARDYPDHKISILCHSFGTWLAYNALLRDEEIKIDALVLVHGVISSHVEKLDLIDWIDWRRLNRVYAWSSKNDRVVKEAAIPPFGKVGFRGFVRHDHKEDYLKPHPMPYPTEIFNVSTEEDHNGVFEDLDKYGERLYEQLVDEDQEILEAMENNTC